MIGYTIFQIIIAIITIGIPMLVSYSIGYRRGRNAGDRVSVDKARGFLAERRLRGPTQRIW